MSHRISFHQCSVQMQSSGRITGALWEGEERKRVWDRAAASCRVSLKQMRGADGGRWRTAAAGAAPVTVLAKLALGQMARPSLNTHPVHTDRHGEAPD